MLNNLHITSLVLIMGLGTHAVFAAESKLPPPTAEELKASYEDIAKLPDWSGAWVADNQTSVLKTNAVIPLTSKYSAKLASLRKSVQAGGKMPATNPGCKLYGVPMFMQQQGPSFDVLYAPGRVIMQSGDHEGRIIYTDGRKLPDEALIDYFNGTSVGHWEGDTLVVETNGIVPDVQFLPGITGSDNLHVSERIKLVSPDKMQDVITLSDPKVFTKPYTYARTLTRHRDWDVTEDVCLSGKSVDYGVGLDMSPAEHNESTMASPPVREIAKPDSNAASLPGGTWTSIEQLPKWACNGCVWNRDPDRGGVSSNVHINTEYLPLTTVYAARLAYLRAVSKRGGDIPTNNYHCWPRGPNMDLQGAGSSYSVVYTPGQVTMMHTIGGEWRIYTDGRSHPDNVVPSFYGHSIGHWEGDTLVVDTVGLRPDVQMYNGGIGAKMHMVDRFQETSPGKVTVDVTITDPIALSAPWNYKHTFTMTHDEEWEHDEDDCVQANRDVDPNTGSQTFSLVPPPN